MLRLVLLCRLHQRRLPGRLLPPGRPHRHLFNRPQAGVLVRTTAAKTLSTGRRRLVRFRLRHHQHRVLHHPPVLHLRLHGGLLMILGRGLFKHGPCPGPLRPPSVLRRHTQVPGNPAFGRLLVLPGFSTPDSRPMPITPPRRMLLMVITLPMAAPTTHLSQALLPTPSPPQPTNAYYTPQLALLPSPSYPPALLPTPPSPATPSWDQAAFLQATNNFAAQGNSGTDWIFDSGASSHMSASSNWLSSCTKSPFPSIILGDGSSIPIYCVGQAQLPSSTKPLLLRDVLVAPALIKNLISVRQFTCDNLVSAEFDPFGLSVKDYLTKAEIARFNSSGDLYSLNGVPAATPPTSMLASVDLWHRRLGHPNPAVLASMLSEFTIPYNRHS